LAFALAQLAYCVIILAVYIYLFMKEQKLGIL